jgi:hypothetical protein
MTPPAALSLTSPAGSVGNPALNSGATGATNGVPNSAAMQSNSQSQFGPGMNPQSGAAPGALGSSSSTYGVAPNPSQMQGANNYGAYGQSSPNAAANSAANNSRNWGGPIVSWQPGYGNWSNGYAGPGAGGSATPSNWSTGYRGLPGNSTQTNVQPGTAPQPSVPPATFGANGIANYEMNNQGPLAFRRGPSPYNTGALNSSAPIGGYSYGYR